MPSDLIRMVDRWYKTNCFVLMQGIPYNDGRHPLQNKTICFVVAVCLSFYIETGTFAEKNADLPKLV